MKKSLLFFVLIISALVVEAADKPNIVLIFIDDMGYGDIGPFGNTINRTPHLDRMAEEGNLLTHFYGSSPAGGKKHRSSQERVGLH